MYRPDDEGGRLREHGPGNGLDIPVAGRARDASRTAVETLFLAAIPLFQDLSPVSLAAVARRARWRSFAPRQVVFLEGEPCRTLHVVDAGRIECYRANAEGREQIVTMFERSGDTFCIASAFATGQNLVTARALVPTRLCVIERETFVDVARQNPLMALRLVQAVSQDVKRVTDLAESLALFSARVRVARLLYERALAEGVRSERGAELARDRLREDEVASRVGAVRVHVSRTLRSLAHAGAIVLDRAVIRIPDLARLERLARGQADGVLRDRPLARTLPPSRRPVTFVTDIRPARA